jgi:signal transduction histidine kinase
VGTSHAPDRREEAFPACGCKEAQMRPRRAKPSSRPIAREKANGSSELTHLRLADMYELSKLFASFENADQPLDPALSIITKTLPISGAILIEKDGAGSRVIVWPTDGESSERIRADRMHAEAAYAYLVGPTSSESIELREQVGVTRLPRPSGTEADRAERFIVIPLVVADRPPFGILQIEGARTFDETDLKFVNAIANLLAIALDRDRAWRRDITRREHAEQGRSHAETRSDAAERDRIVAEASSAKYEALAAENARLCEQARKAVRAREEILAVVSHDLKNPLGAILMTISNLTQKAAPEASRGSSEALGRIQDAANIMLRLIEDLLDFSSIEAGRLAVEREPQGPGSMIDETLARFASVEQAKRLRWTADIQPSLPPVSCDRDRILQVLSNLVANATKAAPEAGHITLRVERRGSDLLFSVTDDGPGISEEDAKHLFERYWRSPEAGYKGTGLGLAIANGIVSAHGGRIWVDSERGRGTAVLFTLPMPDGA